MKTRISLLTTLLLLTCATWAQNPKWFKKARKSQVTVITHNAQDEIKQAQGYYVDENGTVVTEYDLVAGAVRGTIVDADGKEHSITGIQGANSLYNVVRFETDALKTAMPAQASSSQQVSQLVYIMPISSNDKKVVCQLDTIAELQEFDEAKYPYYKLSRSIDSRYAGCPVFNEAGELIGHIQMSANGDDQPAFVLGIQYSKSLSITALDANNADLNATSIPKVLPDDENQASTFLFLMNKQNEQAFENQVKAFIEKFPTNTTGYIQLAELKVRKKDYKAAEDVYTQAMTKQTENEDELHHSFAKQLYQLALKGEKPAEGWDMERALQEASAAYSCNPIALYTSLEGHCLYALGRYNEAFDKFIDVNKSNLRSAENFVYAAQCKQMAKAPIEEVYALQDSAVNCYTKPYPAEAAPYIYLRATSLAEMKKFREAVADMNEFEHLTSANVSAKFYYEREQMEIQCKQFQNALNDIERAASLDPKEPLYSAEEAALNYRVGQLEEAVIAAKEAIKRDDTFADAHRILGVCLRDLGKSSEAKKSLQRAIELGDEAAKTILEKM